MIGFYTKAMNSRISIKTSMADLFFDACSLIYLTKIAVKELLPKLGGVNVCVTVKEELLEDEEKYPDAKILKRNLDKKIINVNNNSVLKPRAASSLGQGERETIECCFNTNIILVCDDRQAVNHAIGHGLKPKTSEIILLDMLGQEILTEAEFMERFDNLATIKQLKPPIISFFKERAIDIAKKRKSSETKTEDVQ
jgi:predicted nucleic acid-binding protein